MGCWDRQRQKGILALVVGELGVRSRVQRREEREKEVVEMMKKKKSFEMGVGVQDF